MAPTVTIALDAMGGDHGPKVTVPAARKVLANHPNLRVVLVGDQAELERRVGGDDMDGRLRIRHASQTVAMDEVPGQALRSKKDSSMRVGINLVKNGEAAACVSAGNTGALMATARFVLKTLPGIDRPAICTALPTTQGHFHMLDLGANVDCTAEHLLQFAVMGSELVTAVDGNKAPRVALLNIGEEDIKGNETVKEAARLLRQANLNYVGYIEGHRIYLGDADVVVCDGFAGNIALKASEGIARLLGRTLKQEFNRSWLAKLMGLMAYPIFSRIRQFFDPRRYNGASLLGLRGIVVKSHGGADVLALANAIEIAVREVEMAIPQRISEHLETIFAERQAV
jgi:glycerol-3-phosphate acyltransferase PlsX